MEKVETDYAQSIKDFLLVKQEFNPNYSLRAFARDLEMPVSSLSNVLQGKQGLSELSATRIANKLNLSKIEKNHFIDKVLARDARAKMKRHLAVKRLKDLRIQDDKKGLHEDYFHLVSEWYYFAILELLLVKDFQSNEKWIADSLDVKVEIVEQAMKRLTRLGLIEFIDDEYRSTNAQLKTSCDTPSINIKKHNMQILKKASDALINQPVDSREFATLTVAIDEEAIDFVKEKIRRFQRELNNELTERSNKKKANKVYCLAIQFFDLLKGIKND